MFRSSASQKHSSSCRQCRRGLGGNPPLSRSSCSGIIRGSSGQSYTHTHAYLVRQWLLLVPKTMPRAPCVSCIIFHRRAFLVFTACAPSLRFPRGPDGDENSLPKDHRGTEFAGLPRRRMPTMHTSTTVFLLPSRCVIFSFHLGFWNTSRLYLTLDTRRRRRETNFLNTGVIICCVKR